MTALPVPSLPMTPETAPFWEAVDQSRLVLPRCLACQTVIWYPRSFCPSCHTAGVEWVESSGLGTVYSFAITRKGDGSWRDAGPYVLAYVELEEGPRVLTNLVECEPFSVAVGQRVEVVFEHNEEGRAVPRFRPCSGESG